jgi:hypothetical protein
MSTHIPVSPVVPPDSQLRLSGLKARAVVLGLQCNIECTLRTHYFRMTAEQVDSITVDNIIAADGQTITPNMLTFDQLRALLSTVKQQIKPI